MECLSAPKILITTLMCLADQRLYLHAVFIHKSVPERNSVQSAILEDFSVSLMHNPSPTPIHICEALGFCLAWPKDERKALMFTVNCSKS